LKYFELEFLPLQPAKILCELITIRLSYKRNKKVPFMWKIASPRFLHMKQRVHMPYNLRLF